MQLFSSHIPLRSLIILCLFLLRADLLRVSCDMIDRDTTSISQIPNPENIDVAQAVKLLKEAMRNISQYIVDMDSDRIMPPRCLRVQCRVICSHGRQSEIANDISEAMTALENGRPCEIINELHLYNYTFPNARIPVGFLSYYTNRTKLVFISISNIIAVDNGAFGDGIFKYIVLENLRLTTIHKEFFHNISSDFKGLSIMQQNMPIQTVYPDFLEHVKYQIEHLQLSAGLTCIRNITATDPILARLDHADFSFNNFNNQLLEDTFKKLTMVTELILSHSNITFLPNYIFQGLKYLRLLDISHNRLTTISKMTFGIQEIPINLRIFGHHNDWHCDCDLVTAMFEIFIFNFDANMICLTPDEYKNWTVFDIRICGDEPYVTTTSPPIYTTSTIHRGSSTRTTTLKSTTNNPSHLPTLSTTSENGSNEIVSMECHKANDVLSDGRNRHKISWPEIYFFPSPLGALTVKITVDINNSESTFGLFWFSKTSKEYYMLEITPQDFGFGCYYTMPLETIVTDLVPNMAYTFCLVDDQQTVVSPFSCKSIYIGGNLDLYYNSWLSRNKRAKGISLMVLGVVFFLFLGILSVFLILKQKPIWLKGSKRIIKPKHSTGEIVVLPRTNTAALLQRKENMISRINQHRFISFHSRHNSMESLASSDSYIENNIYEFIPAYITFDKVPPIEAPSQPELDLFDEADENRVRYAKITPRTKRISSDPLPALPTDAYDVLQGSAT